MTGEIYNFQILSRSIFVNVSSAASSLLIFMTRKEFIDSIIYWVSFRIQLHIFVYTHVCMCLCVYLRR